MKKLLQCAVLLCCVLGIMSCKTSVPVDLIGIWCKGLETAFEIKADGTCVIYGYDPETTVTQGTYTVRGSILILQPAGQFAQKEVIFFASSGFGVIIPKMLWSEV